MGKLDSKLLKNLKYDKNLIFENINMIIGSNKRVGIYGNGVYAKYLTSGLKKWSIGVDYYVVDDEYYNNNSESKVIKISDLAQYNDTILIIGFETLIGKENFLREKKAKALYYAPGIELVEFNHCYIDFDFITYRYILDNHEAFQETFDVLSDDISKRVMVEYLNTCISGRPEALELLSQAPEYDYDYDLLYPETGISGVAVECGAYNGKTALELNEYLLKNGIDLKILALEPDSQNYDTLCQRTREASKIIPLKLGAASKDGVLYFDEQGGSGSTIVNGDNEQLERYTKISVRSLDNLMNEYGKIDSVLMDIEGSELDALRGCTNAIIQSRPRFAVRVYHLKNDLITIPQFFMNLSMDNKYRLFLRKSQNTRGHLDVTLYAI